MKISYIRGIAACFVAVAGLLLPFKSSGAETKTASWKSLFTGTNLDGFYIIIGKNKRNEDPNHLVQIHDKVVHMYRDAVAGSSQPHGYIATEREYSDYQLRFEYKWGIKRFAPRALVKRDAGVIYHMFGNDGVWPKGVECQVQEGDVGDIFTVNTRVTITADPATTNFVMMLVTNETTRVVRTNQNVQPVFLEANNGGVPFVQGVSNNIRRVIRNPMNEHDGWNTVEVMVRGNTATHIVNGKVNNRISAMEQFANGQWVTLTRGKIIFQLEGAEVLYRNIEIKELKQ